MDEGEQRGRQSRPEHRQARRITHQHEHHDRNQRGEVVPVTLREHQRGLVLREHHFGHGKLARVDLHHGKDCQVVENCRDGRHQDHVQIRDLEELCDQERGGPQHRRREDRTQSSRSEQTSRGFLPISGLLQERPGDRPDGDGCRDTGARGPAEQKRRHDHRAPRARGLPAHRGERKVDEEFPGAGILQHGAVDGEQNDERRRDVDRRAEDALERHVQVTHESRYLVSLVRPRRRQIRAE